MITNILRTIAKSIPVGIIAIENGTEKIVYANERFVEITGLNPSGFTFREFALNNLKARKIDNTAYLYEQLPMVKALLHGKITNNEEIVIIKSGKKRLISVNAKPLRDDRGEITGALAILEDITERKKSEQKLTENEERLNMAQKIAHMGSWEYFANQDKAIWSEELFNIFRLKPQTYGPNVTTYAKLIHPQDREEINRVMEKLLFNAKTGDIASFDYRILTPDNSVRTLHSIRMVREVDENGKTARIMGIELDVTDRRIAEEELNATKKHLSNEVHWLNKLQEINTLLSTEQKIQTLLHKIVEAAIEFTHADTGNLQLVTKENELKTVAQHGLNQPFLNFFNCVDIENHAVCAAAMTSKKRIIIPDVTKSPLLNNTPALQILQETGIKAVQSTPLITRSGKFLGVISTHYMTQIKPEEVDLRFLDLLVRQASDFIERMQNEKKIKQYNKNLEKLVETRTKQLSDSERLAAIGATAGMVGHDIRNPLQGISSDIFLLKDYLNSMPDMQMKKDVAESIEGIDRNVEYINKIVADLQDYAREINPSIQEVDLQTLFCIDELSKNSDQPNINASCTVEEEAKIVTSDAALLKRILSNLISNAIQAMPQGGNLTLHAYREAEDVVITVEDTGVGIPKAVKEKLFTPMFTTKAKGQGFGLSVVKRLTEALGGTVSYESEVGRGTKFTVRLPPK